MKVRIIGIDQKVQGGRVDRGHLPTDQPCSIRRSREQFSGSCPSPLSLPPNSDSSESGMLSRLGDLLFYTIGEGQERIPIHKFTTVSSSPPARDTYPLGSLETGKRKVGQVQGS